MSNKITEKSYWELSKEIYKDENLKNGKEIYTKDGTFYVVEPIDKKNGLQAAAVVSQADYKKIQAGKQPSNVIFVSRGTEELKDWGTNFGELGMSQVSPDELKAMNMDVINDNSQFVSYSNFVDSVLKTYNPQDYVFTGHSLGGALAQYQAVLHDKYATTFAAAKAYRLLPEELQRKVDRGEFNFKITDYRHDLDPVGHLPSGEVIGRRYQVKSGKARFPIRGHFNDSFEGMFNEDGTMILEENFYGSIASSEMKLFNELIGLGDLRQKWGNQGSLSRNQSIFLDQSEALSVLNNTHQIVKSTLGALTIFYDRSIVSSEELWTDTLSSAQGIGENLTNTEVTDALAKGTATESFIVTEPTAIYEEEKQKLSDILASYDDLIQQLTTSINEIAANDDQIAAALRSM